MTSSEYCEHDYPEAASMSKGNWGSRWLCRCGMAFTFVPGLSEGNVGIWQS